MNSTSKAYRQKTMDRKSKQFFLKLGISLILTLCFFSCKKQSSIGQYIDRIPEVEDSRQVIEINFKQPLDHNFPEGESFTQRVIINHVGYDKPTVVYTEGYALNSKKRGELARLLDANQITIEHRFYEKSSPDERDWQYLTIWQSATDHHKVIQAFKELYKGKWITTGISKGGQASIFHRYFYPEDVDVSVPYVAPINFSDEDKRVYEFLDTVGNEYCKKKILAFQKQLFKRKDEILPLFKEMAKEKDYQFAMGIERAYDLSVLEYPFAFWQWKFSSCYDIPDPDDSIQELFSHLEKISDGAFFEKDYIEYDRPFFYQAMTEIGMYGYEIEPFKKYLKDSCNIKFDFTLPKEIEAEFNPEIMQRVNEWIQSEGDYMLYIYGEDDPWSATSVVPSPKTNAVKMVNPDGSHRTRIKHFPAEMKDSIYEVLEKWTDLSIDKKQKN